MSAFANSGQSQGSAPEGQSRRGHGSYVSFPELSCLPQAVIFWREGLTKFQELPDDCTCNGEGLAPVSSVPRVGGLPELVTYECPVCGHVETVEKHADRTQPEQ